MVNVVCFSHNGRSHELKLQNVLLGKKQVASDIFWVPLVARRALCSSGEQERGLFDYTLN